MKYGRNLSLRDKIRSDYGNIYCEYITFVVACNFDVQFRTIWKLCRYLSSLDLEVAENPLMKSSYLKFWTPKPEKQEKTRFWQYNIFRRLSVV